MIAIILLIFCIAPLLSIPLVVIALANDKKKHYLYYFIISIVLGIVAYSCVFDSQYDLFRHHSELSNLSNITFSAFIRYYLSIDEPVQYLFKFFIAQTNNFDLLQFSVVFLGYNLIFYIIYDYSKEKKISNLNTLLVLVITLVTFNFINFTSGLWFYLAIILFTFSVYLEYYKKKNKYLCWILIITSFFIHSSLIFAIIIKIIFEILKRKINVKTVILLILALFLMQYILIYLANNSTIPLLDNIGALYNSYFILDQEFATYYYTGKMAIIELLKALVIIILYIYNKENKDDISNLTILILIAALCLRFDAPIMTRFLLLSQLLSIKMLINFFNSKKSQIKPFIIVSILLISIYYTYIQYSAFQNIEFRWNEGEILIKNIITIFRK